MIIARSPMRITLGGGGTDLPSYYRDHKGFVISAAIDKYVYITLHETFAEEIIVKYSKMEVVGKVEDIKHPIVREAINLVGIGVPHLEITSMSDIPAGTGLGSSGSFTTALLRALYSMNRNSVGREQLAREACCIEIDRLKEPIGKQDQYIAAFGGITCFEFERDDSVSAKALSLNRVTTLNLEDGLMLFFTNLTRNASDILKDQDTRSRAGDHTMIDGLHYVKQLGYESKAALEAGDLKEFAQIMHVHWEHKRRRSNSMSNGCIDRYYQLARDNGALGGKLIGAGGGGFLMFYTEDKTRLRRALTGEGLREVRFRFDFEGTKVIVQ